MTKKEATLVDTLFGSKTRVKLLHLFYSNPNTSFYVREITRLVDEQINSVRRELSNLLSVGVIASDTAENKLYYQVNKQYNFYSAFRMIFAENAKDEVKNKTASSVEAWRTAIVQNRSIKVAVIAGALVPGSASPVDLLLVGSTTDKKVKSLVAAIEKEEGRDINYTTMKYDDFYYRMSIRDAFLMSIFSNKHEVLVDSDNIVRQ